jgi:acyl-CoA synthetase (AMP-forming)/AMP-acid ligase II
VPPGTPGQITYRGPNVCLGYLDPAHRSAAIDPEGFLHSGDLGVVDEAGYLRIVGRTKDIIIRGGENISPAEVEDLLFGHPMIQRVSVIGYPDERLGQRACAVVVPAPGHEPTLADIAEWMSARQVAKFKYPEAIRLVDALPLTASGKVRKDVLRETLFGAVGE